MAMLNNQMVSRMWEKWRTKVNKKTYGAWRSDHTLHAASKRFESFVPWGGSGRSVKQKGGNVGNPWKPEKWHFFWWFFISESILDGRYVDFLASRSTHRLHGSKRLATVDVFWPWPQLDSVEILAPHGGSSRLFPFKLSEKLPQGSRRWRKAVDSVTLLQLHTFHPLHALHTLHYTHYTHCTHYRHTHTHTYTGINIHTHTYIHIRPHLHTHV